jgi:hypothetical protein
MATVFVGRHGATGATHAVKVLALGPRAGQRRERFDREARTLARLDHPGVVRIHGHDVEPDGTAWLSLAFVEGEDLAGAIARGPLPWRRAAEVAREVAAALAHAHAAEVVHRDVKPGNVLLEAGTGRVVLTDFGVARDEGEGRLTISQELLGTPTYMAPEQVTGDRARVGPASDVFALGVVLHECLVGRPPFEGESLPALTGAILSLDPPPPSSLRPDVPRALDDVVRAALAKEATDRPTAAALAEALDRVLRDLPSGLSVGAAGPARGGRTLAALAVALVLLAGAGVGLRATSVRARADTRARAAVAAAAEARAAHARAARAAWLAGSAPPDAAVLGSARAALDAAPGAGAEAVAAVAGERAALEVALARAEVEAALAAGRPEAARAALGAASDDPLLAARVALARGDPSLARALADAPSPDPDALVLAARGALAAGDLAAAEAALSAARVRADGAATAGLRRTRGALLRARVLAAAARLDGKAAGELLRRLADEEPAAAREAGAAALELAAASGEDGGRLPAFSRAVRAAVPGVACAAAARRLVEAALAANDASRWSELLDLAQEARAIDPTLLLPPQVGTTLVVEAEALLRGKRVEDAVGAYSLAVRAGKHDAIPARMLEGLEDQSSFDGWLSSHPDDWAARYLRGVARSIRAGHVSPRERPAVVAGALADLDVALAWGERVPRAIRNAVHVARLEAQDWTDPGGTLARCHAALVEGRGRPFEITELAAQRAAGADELPWALLNLQARKAHLDTNPMDDAGLEARRRERAAFDKLADLRARRGEWAELEALAEDLGRRTSDPGPPRFYLARAAAGRGQPAEAIRLCQEILERDPNHDDARRLLRQAQGEQ